MVGRLVAARQAKTPLKLSVPPGTFAGRAVMLWVPGPGLCSHTGYVPPWCYVSSFVVRSAGLISWCFSFIFKDLFFRRREKERERNRLVVSCMHLNWGPNLPPRPVS